MLCRDTDLSNNDYAYTYRSHTSTTITFYNVSSSSNTIVIVDSSNNWDLTDATFLPSQASQSGKFLTTDGSTASWANVPTYSDFSGATGSVAGTSGLVPAPTATDNTKFLKGDGSWGEVSAVTIRRWS